MKDGDILYLKYNASLEESIGITVEDMVLQRKPYIKNYKTGFSSFKRNSSCKTKTRKRHCCQYKRFKRTT